MNKLWCLAAGFFVLSVAFAQEAPVRDTRVYVDGARVTGLKEFDGARAKPQATWTDFESPGGKFKPRWMTDASVGGGNFCVKARLSISRLTFCDASIRIGSGERELIVNLQGINGLFAILGPFVKADAETGRVMAARGKIRKDRPFDLTVQRLGDQLEVYLDGELMRRQWVSDGAVGPVSIVPVRGLLHVERLEVTANFLPFEMGPALDVNRLCKVRPCAPIEPREGSFPLGPFVNLKDGSVLTVVGREAWVSADEGRSWQKHPMFRDAKFRTIPEHAAVCLKSGTVVVTFVNVGERHYSWDLQKQRPNPDNRLPTYSVRSVDNGRTWEDPVLIANDYSGCMRDIIQLRDGTLVAMVQRLNFPEGRNFSQPYWSDDEGRSWHGADIMDCGNEHGDHSGLIEATLVELKDGRVWTLLRSYHGCFYEAFSSDSGRTWSPVPPRKSKIASTGSPGSIFRMSDGSLLLVHNALPTEGYERREELSVQFSDDEGETWTKPYVIAKCPGARVAYPYVLERRPGELWISAMQGNLKAKTTLTALRAAAGAGIAPGKVSTVDAAAFGFSPEASPEANAQALQRAVAGGNRRVTVSKPGVYRMGATVWLEDNTELACEKGVLFRKAAAYPHLLINRGALTGVTNVNITLRGFAFSDGGINKVPAPGTPLHGLWGHLAFWRVKNLHIVDFSCTDYSVEQYCLQVVSFDGLTVEDFVIRGEKDGIHLNSGRNFVIRNGRLRTQDDGIAINAGEWPGFTPEMGSITDGLVENVVDEAGGSCNFARVITGAWTAWHPGMRFQRADIFAHGGQTYIVYPAPRSTNEIVSLTPPTHLRGIWKSPEGINFIRLQPDLWRQASITNVTFRNCTLNERKRGLYCQWENSEWARLLHPDVPAAEYPKIDIRLENVRKTAPGPLIRGSASARIRLDDCHAAGGVLADMRHDERIPHPPVRTFVVDGRSLPPRTGATVLREE